VRVAVSEHPVHGSPLIAPIANGNGKHPVL
jgi:hypothetical protein